ncbi:MULTISPECIES: Holliday junction branch migration protein RuvA [unclassified Granulicatella]|uniref:Holliday junction branch migration protein RuvA n=1 Tax=unclassified Granulicatella TaxID=2630493 RepID=UPI0006616AA8|nr:MULTISPECIES: Holliday junction branch migration protein RuvA [unclassified Granulicatella]MBF1709499.1 Holliday junction branch migration protein RuvA [Streptococcus sp.]MDK8381513.1 Holliday junction branch migration protein RuvA [Granulicatella sp. UMB5615B]MDK8522720.1 Holliday junction branch migration protein RuvA [Granulicatella sp. UMB5615A]
MYEYLNGELAHILPTAIVVDVHGVGYQVVFANPYRLQDSLKKQIKVLVQQVVREDSITLYGFISSEERELFQRLISVSGIGPKSAMSILANDDTEGFVNAVESGNVTYLTKFPGVGKKTAQQIILDLKGKFEVLPEEATKAVVSTNQATLEEAKEALLGLGYSAKEITKIWKSLEAAAPSTTQEALKVAFKLLMK